METTQLNFHRKFTKNEYCQHSIRVFHRPFNGPLPGRLNFEIRDRGAPEFFRSVYFGKAISTSPKILKADLQSSVNYMYRSIHLKPA